MSNETAIRINKMDEDYKRWKSALLKYKANHEAQFDEKGLLNPNRDTKHDAILESIFTGSKYTARFLFRSCCQKERDYTESNYDKDCKDFGKARFDGLVDKILGILP